MDISGQAELTNEMTPAGETAPETKQVSVFDLEVKTENQALNILVAFLYSLVVYVYIKSDINKIL